MEKPTLGSIVRNNLLVMLAVAVVLGLAAQFFGEGALMLFAAFYLGQALYNLIVALAHLGRGPDDVGAAPYFLSLLLVLIVGFGACSGLFVITGSTGAIRL
jgi:multicomponent K+:H+ antiporter subunit F